MISVYDAQNGLEAHMILNLLQQAGIEGRVEGDLLQGAIGELQAMGIVRVMVEETDYERAREILDEWDQTQVDETPSPHSQDKRTSPHKYPHRYAAILVIGICCGVAATSLFHRSADKHTSIDYNGDGKTDRQHTYRNERLRQAKQDRNFNGEIDVVTYYDIKGNLTQAKKDDDFDGHFETHVVYRNNLIDHIKVDTNKDGFFDLHQEFENGVLKIQTLFDSHSRHPISIKTYSAFRLLHESRDEDRDGRFDSHIEYNQFGNVIKESRL